MIKTVLGTIPKEKLGITLPHEHICCYSEYAYKMMGAKYLDKERLATVATDYLRHMKESYQLGSFVDCTPVNIGRDINLLKRVSENTEIHIVCSTGFYYTDEPVFYNTSADRLCQYVVTDAQAVNASVIKCAVEQPILTEFQKKLLRACAKAHLYLGLPIVLHTNAKNQNALLALEILCSEGVPPHAVTVGHLSDTRDIEFVKTVASYGCLVAMDRLYDDFSEEYIARKLDNIRSLCEAGYEKQLLLSHDALFFSGFRAEPQINEHPRFSYCFDHILPKLPHSLFDRFMIQNPMRMLSAAPLV